MRTFLTILTLIIAVCLTRYVSADTEAATVSASPAKAVFAAQKAAGPLTGKFPVKVLTSRTLTTSEVAYLIRTWREGDHAEISPVEAAEIAKAITEAAMETGIDPYVLTAMGYVESRFFRERVSGVGAVGIWQQLPRYSGVFGDGCWEGSEMICRAYDSRPPVVNLEDPYIGAMTAARHLTYLYNRYRDPSLTSRENMRNALAHYNGGNNPARECWTRYADAILNRI